MTYVRRDLKKPFVPLSEKGYYQIEEYPPIYLIVVNELPIISKNYALLIFAASEKKFKEFLKQVIAEGHTAYIRYAYAVRPQTTKEVLLMAGIASRLTRADLEFMADDIGQELLAIMQPEDVLKGLDETRQDRLLALISPEERLSGLSPEDLLKSVNAEQRQRLLETLSQEVGSEKEES